MHKITIIQMIGYGDKTRTQMEVALLFYEGFPDLPPISQGKISKIEKQFLELGHVKKVKKEAGNAISEEDTKLDVMFEFEEHPHTFVQQAAPVLDISYSSVSRILKENKLHPYKIIHTQELMEDDFARRKYFCEQMMAILDSNVIQLEHVLFSDESTFTLHGHAKLPLLVQEKSSLDDIRQYSIP